MKIYFLSITPYYRNKSKSVAFKADMLYRMSYTLNNKIYENTPIMNKYLYHIMYDCNL